MAIGTGLAILGAGALGAGAQIFGAQSGANAQRAAAAEATAAQTAAANRAMDFQERMYGNMRNDLSPFVQTGYGANNVLSGNLNALTAPITMDQRTLESTPGYQFALSQGLRGVQNSAAARGLGSSGAAMKGAARFATGLADNTYQNQFGNAVTNATNTFNRLMGVANLGQTSAAGVGQAGINTGSNVGNIGMNAAQMIGNNLIGAGNATAGANVASGNALAGFGNNIGQYYMLNALSGRSLA